MSKKILCAIDDSDHSKNALVMAANMAKAMGAELTILVVNQLLGVGGKVGAPSYLWEDSELKSILDKAVDTVKEAGFADPKTASVKSRDVPRAIVVFAEDKGFDHIVVGTGGKGSVSRLMLGSVSRDVVYRAHCPVTIAR
jgi:nucleotide-binding universal stress UspA family protein